MSFFTRLKNVISAGTETADLNSEKLLQWLGIDDDKPKALSETVYFTCLKVLSETMGKMPLKLYKEDDKGGRSKAPSDNERDKVLNRPNLFMTPTTFWSTIEANCQHYGNAYVYIQRGYTYDGQYVSGQEITGLWPMRSDCVTVYMDDAGVFGGKGDLYYQFENPSSGELLVFDKKDVLHFKTWLTWDGIMGKSVREILKSTLVGTGHAEKYLNKLYETGLTASSVLQYTGDLDEKTRSKLQAKYNALLSGAINAGKVVALPVGMTLSPLSYKLADAQFLEIKKYSALQIAAAFGVKPNQINDYEKSSYASSEAQQLAFLVDTMLFRLKMYEEEINFKLLTAGERGEGLMYKFNEKVLLRANAETQIKTITSGIQNGLYTPNEGRHLIDYPSREGGDQLIVNGNYVPLTDVGAAYRN